MAVMTELMRGKVWQFAECTAFIGAGSLSAFCLAKGAPSLAKTTGIATRAFIASKTVYFAVRGLGAAFHLCPKTTLALGWLAGLVTATVVFNKQLNGCSKRSALGITVIGAAMGVGLREGFVKGVDLLVHTMTRV